MKCRVTVLLSNYAPSLSDDHRLCKFLSYSVHIEKGDGWIFGLIDEVSLTAVLRTGEGLLRASNILGSVRKDD